MRRLAGGRAYRSCVVVAPTTPQRPLCAWLKSGRACYLSPVLIVAVVSVVWAEGPIRANDGRPASRDKASCVIASGEWACGASVDAPDQVWRACPGFPGPSFWTTTDNAVQCSTSLSSLGPSQSRPQAQLPRNHRVPPFAHIQEQVHVHMLAHTGRCRVRVVRGGDV